MHRLGYSWVLKVKELVILAVIQIKAQLSALPISLAYGHS